MSLRIQLFNKFKLVTCKKIGRQTQTKITFVILLVIFIVFATILANKIDVMPKIRDYYNNCNRSSELCDEDYFQLLASQLFQTKYSGVENYITYTNAKTNFKPLTGITPLRPEFGPVLNDVTSYHYPIEMEPCQYVNGSSSLFIAIISAVGNFEKRESIRKTWLRHFHNHQSDNTSMNLSGYGFIVGQTKDQIVSMKIEEESRKYGDILQVGIIDNYYNLTLKAVGLVNWLNNHCSNVGFVLKVDDDVYINVRNLEAFITKTLNRSEETLYGSAVWRRTVSREGKWNISNEDWPWLTYPVYPTGASVLFPGIVIKSLLAAAQVVPFLPFDDTYLLGLCTEKAGIKLHRTRRLYKIGGKLDPCLIYNYIGWPAGSSNSMNSSYWATEDFYKNVTQCVIVDSQRGNVTVNPLDYLINAN